MLLAEGASGPFRSRSRRLNLVSTLRLAWVMQEEQSRRTLELTRGVVLRLMSE